jgi:hypothetical protein
MAWYIIDGNGHYLTVPGLGSNGAPLDWQFLDDPRRETAERFETFADAHAFLKHLRPYPEPPYRVVDYADPLAAYAGRPDLTPLISSEPGVSRADLIRHALALDAERAKIRARKLFPVINK